MARAALRAVPKKPGPYRARAPNTLVYNPPPPRTPSYPNPSAPPPPPKDKERSKDRARRIGIYGLGSCAFGMAFYSASLYMSLSQHDDGHADHSPAVQSDVSSVYDHTAEGFDAEVHWSEILMRITKARKRMTAEAAGDVLEVSSGTARNLGYYKFGKITSLTLVDLSPQMVEQGRKKWDVLNPGKVADGVPVRFLQGDCIGDMPGPPSKPRTGADKSGPDPKTGYDTIVQTMGLCSVPAPVQLLRNLARHLDRSNPEAKILLLEHGRSYYAWMNKILDSEASQHADRHGCWWNRDIGSIVEESGLEIVRERRKHFGTTWIFELRPKKSTQMIGEKAQNTEDKVEQTLQAQPQKGWFSWLSG